MRYLQSLLEEIFKIVLEDEGLLTIGLKSNLKIRLEQHLIVSRIDPVQFTYSEPELLGVSTEHMAMMTLLKQIKEEIILGQVMMESLVKDIKAEFSIEMCQVQRHKFEKGLKVTDGKVNEVEERLNEEVRKREELTKKVDKVLQIEKRPIIHQTGVVSSMAVHPNINKESQPNFHHTLEEDQKKLITDSANLLKQTNLPEQIFIHLLCLQLKGSAAIWWQQLRDQLLVWQDFKRELLLRFDSEAVRAAAHKTFLTETQPAGMRAGAFII